MDPGLYPNCKVFGAEPADADDAFRSKRDGTLRKHESACKTVADGLRTTLGPNTFPIVRDLVDKIYLVEEHVIKATTRMVWERMKLCIEPSAAVGVAVALSDAFKSEHGTSADGTQLKRVGVVLCGGNADVDNLPWRN